MCLAVFHLSREIKAGEEVAVGLFYREVVVGMLYRCHPDGGRVG